jgi:nucleotide-binding universal stress UspA family protein
VGWAKQFVPDNFAADLNTQAKAKLDALADTLTEAGLRTKTLVASGNTYVETLAAADKLKADLIVIGAGRDELKDFLLGPSAARVVRHADCSVLVVRS